MQNNNSILALINLMDDPDESIYTHVRDQLLQYGPDAIPYLESSWEHEDYGLLFQDRVENLVHEIQFEANKEHAVKPFIDSAIMAHDLGLGVNAGHDLNLDNLFYFAAQVPFLDEVSIGHALISDALYLGLERTIEKYKNCLKK